jgi:hypothetical protein
MAVQKEIWLPSIEENLFAAWQRLTQIAKDDNIYVNAAPGRGYKVYIPQAGAAGTLQINPTNYPLTVAERSDDTLDYTLEHLVMPPIRLGNFDTSLLTYDKMNSIVTDHAGKIGEAQLYKSFVNWYIGKQTGMFVETSGTATDTSDAPGSTQTVNKMILDDLRKAAKILDTQNIPDDGNRIAALPAQMFYHLLADIEGGSYNINLIEKDGLVMLDRPLYGLKIMKFNQVCNVVTSTYAVRAYGHAGATTDRQAGLVYHKDMVSVARGDLNVFVDEKSATYLGDVVSAEAWIGGKYRRKDYKGIVPIVQKNNQ